MKPKSNYISPEQFIEIVNHVPELHIRKWNDVNVQMSMKIAYYCALRYSEVPRLTANSFDYGRLEVYLGKTKTNKEDYAAIPPFFVDELKAFWYDQGANSGEILPDCQVQNMYKWLKKIGDDLAIEALQTSQKITGEKTVLHIFRKSWLKEIMFGDTLHKQANIGQVQSIARHKRATTTADYLHLDIEGGKELYENNKLN